MHLLSIQDMGSQLGSRFQVTVMIEWGQKPKEIPEPIINPPFFLDSIK